MKVLNEKVDLTKINDLVSEIAEKTDSNDHTGAALALATFLKDKKAMVAYQCIEKLHDYYGSMPMELGKLRSQLTTEMLDNLRHEVTPEIYKKVKGAFY